MPSTSHQPAKFGPIPPDLDLRALVEQTPNFRWVDRISCDAIDEQGVDAFEKTVEHLVIKRGLPLVIDGWHRKLERWTFSTNWLHDNIGTKVEEAREISKNKNMALTVSHYLNNLGKLCDQWNHYNYKDRTRQRLYLKDIDCPDLWHEKLRETIPGNVFYLNESTGDIGGPGALEERNLSGMTTRKGKGIARAGDLMSCLPPAMRAENLMCYIGHEGSYTPAHREMCASLGQNIMVETSESLDEGGKRAKPGSSIWFMTETHDRQVVSEYWLSALGHDIEVEKHFAHINAWRRAPFSVYVVEQKVGDLILIPPLAPHQVWNRGTRTMKVAWNRTTVDTLEMALSEALPRARLVCRDEQYKNKSIVLFTLNKYYALLSQVEERKRAYLQKGDDVSYKSLGGLKIRQLRKDYKRLFRLFNGILLSETFSPDSQAEIDVEYLSYDSNVTCSYCRGNIFNRFLTCRHCAAPLENGEIDAYDICMECYAMGRSCRCIGKLEWVEQFPWRDLEEKHEQWRKLFIQLDGGPKENSPQQLDGERRFKRERSLAEICQIELGKRPFNDPAKQPEREPEPSDDEDGANAIPFGNSKKNPRQKKKSEKWLADNIRCHLCCYRHPKWKAAVCTTCDAAFCYGSLWRGFDMMPQQIQEDKNWQCPKCRLFCTCAHCAKITGMQPFEPTGTVLGHDTSEFADPRSVESLVDFSVSNRHWIRKSGDVDDPDESRRLQRRRSQALQRKEDAQIDEGSDLDADGDVEIETPPNSHSDTSDEDSNIPIDPALTDANWTSHGRRGVAQNQASQALKAMSGLGQMNPVSPAAKLAGSSYSDIHADSNSLFVSERNSPPVSEGLAQTTYSEPQIIEPRQPSSLQGNVRGKSLKRHLRKDDVSQGPEDNVVNGRNEAVGSQPPTANERFQAVAERRRFEEAKKNRQLIAARAAMRGLKKVVVLKLDSAKLSTFPAGTDVVNVFGHMQNVSGGDRAAQIVESNLANSLLESDARSRPVQPSRKRLRDEDIDEDFVNMPSKERRTQKQIRELKAIALKDVEHVDDMSDHSSEGNTASASERRSTQVSGGRQTAKARALPSYLAQRNSPGPELAIPKELRSEPRVRNVPARSKVTATTSKSTLDVPAKQTIYTQSVQINQSREANLLAKLRASSGQDADDVNSNASEEDDDANSNDNDDEITDLSANMPDKQLLDMRRKAKNPALTPRGKAHIVARQDRISDRQSIFASRGRGGKIRIKSARR